MARGNASRRVGLRIRRLRTSNRMSQQALATAVGVHVNTVARWERNGIDPRHKLLPSIAAVLNGDGREKGISYAVLIAG